MAKYIELEAAKQALEEHLNPDIEYSFFLDDIPAADVQPVKHGEWLDLWIEDDEMTDGGFMVNQCSVCKDEMYYGRPNYCPNCGARMDGET